ncbi:hypothetical protein GQ53DRAFT_821455 [Thozetella sp. PMI_491]|nr:hypothetical protein GQ53DRAFT_821455 [Thozetella sp. PMI_491]
MITSLELPSDGYENVFFAAIFVLLALRLGTHLARLILTKAAPRLLKQPHDRQLQFCTVIPLFFLRMTIAVLLAENEFASLDQSGRIKTTAELDYQLQLCYGVAMGYLFELLIVRLPFVRVIHHLLAIGVIYAFHEKRRTWSCQARTNLHYIPALMSIYGQGPFDIGMEGVRLLYYGSGHEKGPMSRNLMKLLIGLAWVSMALQWSSASIHVIRNHASIFEPLTAIERVAYPCILLYWGCMEWIATSYITGLSRKYLR